MKPLRTLADGLAQGSDNFLLLRFIAAAMVIYGHAPAIAGGDGLPDLFVWLNWGEYSGDIAVDLFFITSGFLVMGSWQRRSHVLEFIWARAVRIFPALATCLALLAFVVGPFFTTLPRQEYFAHPDTFAYVVQNLKLGHLLVELPSVFSSNPGNNIVNGSLWTLPVEVRLYLWMAALGLFGFLRRWLFTGLALVLLLFDILYSARNPIASPHVRLTALFVAGAFCYVNRDRIPLRFATLPVLATLAWLCRNIPAYPFAFAAAEIAFVFWFAYGTPWRGFNRFGDYSYGLYLWGYPMQQVVAGLDRDLSFLANAACGFVLALLLAIASWHVVEKPALRMKMWRTRRHGAAQAESPQTDAA